MTFGIHAGYRHRKTAPHFDDTPNRDQWQAEVYHWAGEIANEINASRVIDIGCGSGFKLIQHFGDLDTLGVEVPATYGFLVGRYPARNWFCGGQGVPTFAADLLICADVIEHVANPDRLLDWIDRVSWKTAIFSTPARELLSNHGGPPRNRCHFREWASREFREYLGERYQIVEQRITSRRQRCQAVVVTKRTEAPK